MDWKRQIKSSWDNVCFKVNKSIVFIDDACAQSLHWNGGAMLLFKAGAINIKEFSSFECGGPEERKAVFVVSGPLVGVKQDILRDIVRASSFQYVLVVSSLAPAMHGQLASHNPDHGQQALHELEDAMLEWMGNMNYTVEVFCEALVCAPIASNLFVLPEHQHLFPILPHEKQAIRDQQASAPSDKFELVYTHLPAEVQLRFKLLVCSLNSLLEQLNVNEDCYSVGDTSRIVAQELAALSWAKARRKTAEQRASLLLVDRTLDLASAAGHHADTLLDRVMAVLPRFPGQPDDVLVNMSSLCSVPNMCRSDVIAAGCLAHPADKQAAALLNTMAASKHKESLMEVNRQLVEAASSRNLPVKLSGKPGRITAESLHTTIQLFKGDSVGLREHSGLVQVCEAVAASLEGTARHDAMLATEKGLLQNLHDTRADSPLNQIATIVNRNNKHRSQSLEDIFLLLVYVYSLLDQHDLHQEEELNLKAALEGALMAEELDDMPPFLQELIGPVKSEEHIFKALEVIFKCLESLTTLRDGLKQFDSLVSGGGVTSLASLSPLLKQVTEEIFTGQHDLQDVEYKSTGFRDLLKSGFGLFMNVSKPRPNDHKLLIVFVIGGVTSTEVRQIQEAVSAAKADTQVIVGSTRLVEKASLLQQIFVTDHIH